MARRERAEAAVARRDGKRRKTEKTKEAAVAAAAVETKEAAVETKEAAETKEAKVALAVIDVWSLRAAQALAAQVPGAAIVNIRAVEVRQAAGLLVLLHRQESSKGWQLRRSHSDRLDALVHLDALLAVGIHAHMPIVKQSPFNAGYLCELREWTWDLQTAARGVNKDLYSGAKRACGKVRKMVCRALAIVRKANPLADHAAHRAATADLTSRDAADLAARCVAGPAAITEIDASIEKLAKMLTEMGASPAIFPAVRA